VDERSANVARIGYRLRDSLEAIQADRSKSVAPNNPAWDEKARQAQDEANLDLLSLQQDYFVQQRDLYRSALGEIVGDVTKFTSVLRKLGAKLIGDNIQRMVNGWAPLNGLAVGMAQTDTNAQGFALPAATGALGAIGEFGRMGRPDKPLTVQVAAPKGRSGYNFPTVGGRNTIGQLLSLYSSTADAVDSGNPLTGMLGGALSGLSSGGWVGAAVGGIFGLFGGLFGHKRKPKPAQDPVKLLTQADLRFASDVLLPRTAYLGGRAGAGTAGEQTNTVNIGSVNVNLPGVKDAAAAEAAGKAFAAGLSDQARSLGEQRRRGDQRRFG
jgi:hypothetical protein